MAIPGLYHFFKQVDRVDDRSSADKVLPDPEGQISLKVPSSSIVSANKAAMNASLKRGSNDRFTPEKRQPFPEKLMIVVLLRLLQKYYKSLQVFKLKESTVRTWIILKAAGITKTCWC